MLIHPQIGEFLGFDPLNKKSYKNSQNANLSRVRVVWAVMHENPSTGLTCRWVPQKIGINKNNFCYISPMCPEASPPWTYVHLIWHICCGRRRNHFWQIFSGRLRGVDSVRGAKIALSHWQSQSPLTQCWRYRAACDQCVPVSCCLIIKSHFKGRYFHRKLIFH